MKSRTVLILCVAALVVIAAGIWLAGRDGRSQREQTQALYPELSKELDKLTTVRIFKAGDARAVELVRRGDQWVVTERSGYRADAAQLGRLVRTIAEAKVLEEKTSNPENYKSLGVEDVKSADASGVRVELEGGSQPVKLIVGKPGVGAQSHFVRRADEAASWLVAQSIEAPVEPDAWLRKAVIDVSADRVQSAEVSLAKQKPYTARKSSRADAAFAVAELPKGKSMTSAASSGIATSLAGLNLSDVKPATEFSAAPDAQATIRTFDGLIVQIDGWTRDEKHYVRLKSSYDAELAQRFAAPAADAKKPADAKAEGAPPAKTASASAPGMNKKDSARDAGAEAQQLAAATSEWVYEIPEYRYEQIFKPLSELTSS